MKEDESLKDYSSRFLELINQMKTHGEDISDRRIVEKTLISLPEKFDPIIAVIEETKNLSTLSVQEAMASLKPYEQRMARHTEKAVESAFQSKHVSSKSQERKPHNFDQPRGESSRGGRCGRGREKNDETWFLDSGCSNHMAREKSIFLDMDSAVNTKVKLGNGTIVQTQGKGTIGVQTKQGTRFIGDVLLVPDLEHNLLSLGQLLENDYSLQFQDKCCIIYDKKESKDVVTKIKIEKNRSFPINFSYTSGVAMRASIVEDS
ncbi:hypothetical protein RJ639_004740 [Escallonia herrerae]|uniref:Retrovirus-related Pol polyprotein from transposon TNT 1-94-like beta-barrel domain-containing protein n=1 Tax=Escallonia herrerae TaxID=1293975 RepID=A0AA88W7E0_9ASTE|nr:hypothetical protein RJ639_004740 [Escallonia herrerae]